jgi:predicted dehydrogenase
LTHPLLDNGLDVELTWIIDPDVNQAKFFFKKWVFDPEKDLETIGHSKVNFVKSLAEVNKDEIDVLLLTANERVRTMLFEEALEFDIPVLMEKGLSNSLEGSAKIMEIYRRKKDARVFMAFNLRYNPLTYEVKKIIDRGDIGGILLVNYVEKINEWHGASYYRRFHADTNESGGMLITKSCHDFDLVNYLINDKPDRLFASCKKVLFGKGGDNARDKCRTCEMSDTCEYEMTTSLKTRKEKKFYHDLYVSENAANSTGYAPDSCVFKQSDLTDMSNIIVDYQRGARLNYTQVLFSAKHGREISIFGTDGLIQYNLNDQTLRVHSRWNNSMHEVKVNNVNGSHGGADHRMINDFMKMVRTGNERDARIEDGVWALAMGFAAYQSSESESWVDVREVAHEAGIEE